MRWSDKTIIFMVCSVLLIIFSFFDYAPVVLCVALIYTCLNYIFKNRLVLIFLLYSYVLICILVPVFIFYIPLIAYDNFYKPLKYHNLFMIIPLIYNFNYSKEYILIVLISCIALILKFRTNSLVEARENLIKLRDDSTEYSNLLKEKNDQLIEKQNYELGMATLNERDRISKELHDSIGHLLSRSLIQLGAIITISKDDEAKNELIMLKNSLSQGMDTVRDTIHNMRDESFDLFSRTKEIVDEFKFCKIYYEYEVKNQPEIEIKYLIVATLKEALANIIKHSDASIVHVNIVEHPSMYQFIIYDNGNVSQSTKKRIAEHIDSGNDLTGMGITGMIERVNKLKGIININCEKGFRIFISIKKRNV